MITNQLLRRVEIFFRGWPAGVAMVAMVATGQKSTLGAVARHPGAGVGYLGRSVGSSMTGGRRPRLLATTTLAAAAPALYPPLPSP